MADVSKIKINENEYSIKDAGARTSINSLQNSLASTNDAVALKLDKAAVTNNLVTTEEGHVLDARTGPALYELLGTKLDNTTNHRYVANGRVGVPWVDTMKDAIVIVEFGLNTEIKAQFYICQEMLQSVTNRLISGAYRSSSDNHCVIITYNKEYVRLTNWYYNGVDISTNDSSLCALHVYEHI